MRMPNLEKTIDCFRRRDAERRANVALTHHLTEAEAGDRLDRERQTWAIVKDGINRLFG